MPRRKRRGSNQKKHVRHCQQKRTFETKEEALEEMNWLKMSKEYRKLKRAYVCDVCGYWHLTRKPLRG